MTFIHLDCFGRFAIDGRNKVIKLYGSLSVIVIFCFFKEKQHFDPSEYYKASGNYIQNIFFHIQEASKTAG